MLLFLDVSTKASPVKQAMHDQIRTVSANPSAGLQPHQRTHIQQESESCLDHAM